MAKLVKKRIDRGPIVRLQISSAPIVPGIDLGMIRYERGGNADTGGVA